MATSITGPLLTVGLFLLGLCAWREQLLAKRRFEVAEQVLTATYAALDALSAIRSVGMWGGEMDAIEVAPDTPKREAERIKTAGAYFARAQRTREAFASLRTAQVLAEIHLDPRAAKAIDEIFRAQREALAAVDTFYGYGMNDEAGMEPAQVANLRNLKQKLRRTFTEMRQADGSPEPTDEVSQQLDAARDVIESVCRPRLSQ